MTRTVGKLEVICGPMFAGKTTELLRRVREADASPPIASSATSRTSVALIKPRWDDRYAEAEVVSHAGDRRAARAVGGADEIAAAAADAATVAIDEAHFFGAALLPVCIDLIRQGRRVIVAGVERDHRGRPFEPFPELLCEADEVLKMSGPCAVCGRPALHSQRLTSSTDRIVVGGAEMYQARCRACFEPGS